jgi:hypothetical protein
VVLGNTCFIVPKTSSEACLSLVSGWRTVLGAFVPRRPAIGNSLYKDSCARYNIERRAEDAVRRENVSTQLGETDRPALAPRAVRHDAAPASAVPLAGRLAALRSGAASVASARPALIVEQNAPADPPATATKNRNATRIFAPCRIFAGPFDVSVGSQKVNVAVRSSAGRLHTFTTEKH